MKNLRLLLKHLILLIFVIFLQNCTKSESPALEANNTESVYRIVQVADFEITGDGSAETWEKAEWLDLSPRRTSSAGPLTTRVKAVYSQTGIYFLFYCEDNKLTATMDADFMDLWKEDVVEVFLWPDETDPVYFEYEISPLNYELAILVSNIEADLVRWQPFHYDEDRQTRRATTVEGGEKESHAIITSWTAEFFIPYQLLRPLKNIPPKPGTQWRGNLYRVDYDDEASASWSWQLTHTNFHEYKSFGTFLFE